ncbi:hypothetical protein ACO0KY_15405 [Undibacterium sp. Dicai25W]|uniref:hypothetical protein n=1 Tax=Undibacterium sp. Dicai25W TaxID=3413034 RepID=UPI003BEFFB92
MVTDDAREAAQLRQRVWEQHSGGFGGCNGGDGSQKAMAIAFHDWKQLMIDNEKAISKKEFMTGFLIPFRETREVTFRHG